MTRPHMAMITQVQVDRGKPFHVAVRTGDGGQVKKEVYASVAVYWITRLGEVKAIKKA